MTYKPHIGFSSIILLMIFGICYPVQNIQAQSPHLTARSVSLGSGGTAYQDLYHANFVNPANLMLNKETRPGITIGVAGGIYSQGGGSLLNIPVYNQYLTKGLTIKGEIADRMLNTWFGRSSSDMRNASADAGVIPAGGVYRAENRVFSLAARIRIAGKTELSRGTGDLFFRGLDADYFDQAQTVNLSGEYYAWHEWSAGYAQTILVKDNLFGFAENIRVHAGVAPKLLFSVDFTTANLESTLKIDGASAQNGGEINHLFRYAVKTAGTRADQLNEYRVQRDLGNNPKLGDYLDPDTDDFSGTKGVSMGLDLGLTVEMDLASSSFFDFGIFRGQKKLSVGLSLTDLGALSFSDRARTFSANDELNWTGFSYDREIIDSEFDGDESAYFESVLVDSIGNDLYANFSSDEANRHKIGLPTMARLGSHLMLGEFGFMVDIGFGLTERGINRRRMHLSLGSEYRFFGKIPLRTGIRVGGSSGTTLHAGTGVELRNFEFNVGAAVSPTPRKNGAAAGAAWSGIVVHF